MPVHVECECIIALRTIIHGHKHSTQPPWGTVLTSKNSDSDARNKLIGRAASARCLRDSRAGSVFWGHAGIVAGINSLRGWAFSKRSTGVVEKMPLTLDR